MRVVVDTSVWFEPGALAELHDRLDLDVVVPAIVFTERARQLERDGRRPAAKFLEEIKDAGWRIEPYGVREAMAWATGVTDDPRWRPLARDAMIAGHLREDGVLWTANVRDFLAVGVPRRRVVDISAFRG